MSMLGIIFLSLRAMIRDIHSRKNVTYSEEELQKVEENEWK